MSIKFKAPEGNEAAGMDLPRLVLRSYYAERHLLAARWARRNGRWDLVRGNVYPSPSLSREERQFLRGMAKSGLKADISAAVHIGFSVHSIRPAILHLYWCR